VSVDLKRLIKYFVCMCLSGAVNLMSFKFVLCVWSNWASVVEYCDNIKTCGQYFKEGYKT
jgi:hypothetical protein